MTIGAVLVEPRREQVESESPREGNGLFQIIAVGADIPGQPIRDFFALDARAVAD